MIDSITNQIRVFSSWFKHYEVRGLIFGLIYVLLLITIGQLASYYTALNHRQSTQTGQELQLKVLLKSIPKVKRESRYDSSINELSALLKVRTRYEQCPALLIHENVIITGGDCAQSLGFDHLKGQTWRVSSPKSDRVKHLQHNAKLRAKVIKSMVNPKLKLAVHVLDKALPYAPLDLPQVKLNLPYSELLKKPINLLNSRRFAGFIVYRNQNNGKLLLSGRTKNAQSVPFKYEAITWLNDAKNALLAAKQNNSKYTHEHAIISKL